MSGPVKATLVVGAVALVPTVACLLGIAVVIEKVAEHLDAAQQELEAALRVELESWTVRS